MHAYCGDTALSVVSNLLHILVPVIRLRYVNVYTLGFSPKLMYPWEATLAPKPVLPSRSPRRSPSVARKITLSVEGDSQILCSMSFFDIGYRHRGAENSIRIPFKPATDVSNIRIGQVRRVRAFDQLHHERIDERRSNTGLLATRLVSHLLSESDSEIDIPHGFTMGQ